MSIQAHAITVDESTTGSVPPDIAHRAYCVCGWADRWIHADEFPDDGAQEPDVLAFDAALGAGREHVESFR